jgi:hypothetical protein
LRSSDAAGGRDHGQHQYRFFHGRSPISGKPTPPHLQYVNRCEFEFEIVSVNRVNSKGALEEKKHAMLRAMDGPW